MDQYMLTEGIVGIIGSVLGALSSWLAVSRTIKAPMEALQEKVSRLEREKVNALQTDLERHIADDKSQRMLTLLEGIQGNMSVMAAKIDRLCEESAKHAARIDANEKYIANLDASIQRRKQE